MWPGSGRVRRRGRARRGYKRPRAPLRVWRARIRVLQNPQGMAICWLAKLYCWLSFSWRSCWFVEHARAHGPRPLRGTTPRRPLPQLGPGHPTSSRATVRGTLGSWPLMRGTKPAGARSGLTVEQRALTAQLENVFRQLQVLENSNSTEVEKQAARETLKQEPLLRGVHTLW